MRPYVPVSHAVPHVHVPARPVATESNAVPHPFPAVPPAPSEPVPAPSMASVPPASAGMHEWWSHSSMHEVLLPGGMAAVPKSAILEAIKAAHRKPRRRSQEFKSEMERRGVKVDSEIEFLVPLLPMSIVRSMLGGEVGLRQVPSAEARAAQLCRLLPLCTQCRVHSLSRALCVVSLTHSRALPY